MSEIEKMYENAGIKPTHYDACALEDKYWNNEEHQLLDQLAKSLIMAKYDLNYDWFKNF